MEFFSGEKFAGIAKLIVSNALPGVNGLEMDEESSEDEVKAPRAASKKRDFRETARHVDRLYFNSEQVYDEKDFERHFRVRRRIFDRIEPELQGNGELFLKKDYTGK